MPVRLIARGLLDRLFTRAYLPRVDEAAGPLLSAVDPARRHTLVAGRDGQGLVFDLRRQGPDETVFLDHTPH